MTLRSKQMAKIPKGRLVEGLTLPETNIFAPENGWLEYDCFPLK